MRQQARDGVRYSLGDTSAQGMAGRQTPPCICCVRLTLWGGVLLIELSRKAIARLLLLLPVLRRVLLMCILLGPLARVTHAAKGSLRRYADKSEAGAWLRLSCSI